MESRGLNRYCEHGMQPFVVYRVYTPGYPASVIGLRTDREPTGMPGSAIIISAGLQAPCIALANEPVSVSINGLYYKYGKVAARFMERAVAVLLAREERVVVSWTKGNQAYPGPINGARHAGFDVTDAPGDVLCIGPGSNLGRLRWLKNNPARNMFIFASRHPIPHIEGCLAEIVRSGESTYEFWSSFWRRIKEDPKGLLDHLEGLTMLAGVGQSDDAHAFVVRKDTDATIVNGVFAEIAIDIAVPLYRAESPAQESDFFGLSRLPRYGLQLIPESWRRVVP